MAGPSPCRSAPLTGPRADFDNRAGVIFPCQGWLGRVNDGFDRPIDGKGALPLSRTAYPIKALPLPAHGRARVGGKLDLGVRALNQFVSCCKGQRTGIFSGSSVGKFMLLAMLARNTDADAIVVGLVGERGRELKEFIEDDLGEEGLKRSAVVAATSDEPAMVRRQAAYVAMTVAEQLRDQGLHVLLLMDSVTRFAMAQREIGLSAGEPPASKGYTPTVFAELPRLLERAGPGEAGTNGSIKGLFTVLVEGDDMNEPVADAVCGILDGHIVLDRAIAERRRFPAINVLKSVSRAMPQCNSDEEQTIVARARATSCLRRHGGTDPSWRLQGRNKRRGRRRHQNASAAPRVPRAEEGRTGDIENWLHRTGEHLRRRQGEG